MGSAFRDIDTVIGVGVVVIWFLPSPLHMLCFPPSASHGRGTYLAIAEKMEQLQQEVSGSVSFREALHQGAGMFLVVGRPLIQ